MRDRGPAAREWVGQADGDDFQLLLQALAVRAEVATDEAEVRVEVPMIEGLEGADFATTAQTSVLAFRSYKIEHVPLVLTVPLPRRRRGTNRA